VFVTHYKYVWTAGRAFDGFCSFYLTNSCTASAGQTGDVVCCCNNLDNFEPSVQLSLKHLDVAAERFNYEAIYSCSNETLQKLVDTGEARIRKSCSTNDNSVRNAGFY